MKHPCQRWRLAWAAAILLASSAHPASAARLTVCALSFNTPYEVDVFRSELPADEFDVVDLSPPRALASRAGSSPSEADAHGSWPSGLCRKDLTCDVVVHSGEFAGRFFGAYGGSIGLQEMEELSCQPRCDGLFHHAREVFLLACNTLATKDEDRRRPGEYLNVLLDHGFDRASAERVVAMRYGPLGPSFREASRRIFMGVPRIYGFSSVAPAGEHTAGLLARYFRAKGDYRRYLDRARGDTGRNTELLAAFRGTGLVQVPGLSVSESAAVDRSDVCRLYDERTSVADRLRVVAGLLDRDDPLAFLPAIQVFIGRHPAEELRAEERRVFAEIQHRDAARAQVLELVRLLDVSALKMELAHLARHLDWMTAGELRDLAVAGARQLLARPLSSEVVDVMCEIPGHVAIGDAFRSADLPEGLFQDPEGVRFVDCLSPAGEEVSARLARGLDGSDTMLRLWAGYALSHRLPLGDAVLRTVAAHLDDPSSDVRERLRWIVGMQAPVSADVRRVVEAHDPALAAELGPRGGGRRGLYSPSPRTP